MQYNPQNIDNLVACITYGSHLYGTNTDTSDHDFKVIVLPELRDLILGKTLQVQRFRFDPTGQPVDDHTTMPANGYEAEHISVHKLVSDYIGGQAYAVEVIFAVLQGFHKEHLGRSNADPREAARAEAFEKLCKHLATKFKHRNVNGMIGFAMKQTFDYVRRGERFALACKVLEAADKIHQLLKHNPTPTRLDTMVTYVGPTDDNIITHTVLDEIVLRTGLEKGQTINRDKTFSTLKLNGREYLETTTLGHFCTAVEALIDSYGERSTRAAETDVDWKSLSHAVRVYQQVNEYFETGFITFPRQNAKDLLKIKSGQRDIEWVTGLLRDLDDLTTENSDACGLSMPDALMKRAVDADLYDWLCGLYFSK